MVTQLLFVAHGINDSFLRACDQSLETVLIICRFITPTFMSIALLISIGRGYLSGHGLQIDFSPVIKALTLFLLLFFYQDLMNILGAGIKAVTQLFDGTENVGEALQKLTTPPGIAAAAQSDNVAPSDVVEQGGAWYSKIYNSIASFSIMNLITQFFTTTTVLIVRQTVLFIRQFILGFLYVIGPIAICLSVVPAFSGLAIKWLQNFIAVQFWALTMNLLDLIYANFAEQNTIASGMFGSMAMADQSYNDAQFLLMSVAFIILYIMVPTLTSYFIGSTAVQSFMGAAVGMAAGAAATAGAVAFPAAAGGGASSALGRAMGFTNTGGSGSVKFTSSSSPGFSSNSSNSNNSAPAMASGGGIAAPVRYKNSTPTPMATTTPAGSSVSKSSISPGSNYKSSGESGTGNSSGTNTKSSVAYTGNTLPTMSASENAGTAIRQTYTTQKLAAYDDLEDLFKD
ncbi:hypothetical protein [Adhaeribacter rhizoryzae]|uniref:Conjugative transposon TraJ C-terminal domain-containing protein n=1 Tax=Adhaeribacter rhizoryzae TaxID=2607907 RepID=A0A5M6CWQ3_9BACT|nr:hypothetical protein [Adhaeribacter rhizoryzae]KAA5539647.1 hypothetical protein F0145_23970 [Adhaeribacter rhizoryzae]